MRIISLLTHLQYTALHNTTKCCTATRILYCAACYVNLSVQERAPLHKPVLLNLILEPVEVSGNQVEEATHLLPFGSQFSERDTDSADIPNNQLHVRLSNSYENDAILDANPPSPVPR